MNKNIAIVILVILAVLSLFFNGYLFYKHTHQDASEPIYITLRDTVVINSIRIKEKTKTEYITKDSILYIYKTDSIIDSVYVPIDIEHKIYKDTLEDERNMYDISIHYSGYNSSIDEISWRSIHSTVIDVPKQKQRKFHIALTAGMYCGYDFVDKGVYCGPGAGLSFSYDLW